MRAHNYRDKRVTVVLTNYNMPEKADALYEAFEQYVQYPHNFIIVDNGSDIQPPAQHTAIRLDKNIQTTKGWLEGLRFADIMQEVQEDSPSFAYMFLITSAEYVGTEDVLTPMVELMHLMDDCVGVHAALTEDSTTAWHHLKTRNVETPRRTWMIDNICSLWRADWFNSIGRFDPRLIYGWGIDLETSYIARKQNKSLWVQEFSKMRKITDIGYTMGRMNMSADQRQKDAGRNMHHILAEKYGNEYWHLMTKEFVDGSLV